MSELTSVKLEGTRKVVDTGEQLSNGLIKAWKITDMMFVFKAAKAFIYVAIPNSYYINGIATHRWASNKRLNLLKTEIETLLMANEDIKVKTEAEYEEKVKDAYKQIFQSHSKVCSHGLSLARAVEEFARILDGCHGVEAENVQFRWKMKRWSGVDGWYCWLDEMLIIKAGEEVERFIVLPFGKKSSIDNNDVAEANEFLAKTCSIDQLRDKYRWRRVM